MKAVFSAVARPPPPPPRSSSYRWPDNDEAEMEGAREKVDILFVSTFVA
jgi:hypothetical protein